MHHWSTSLYTQLKIYFVGSRHQNMPCISIEPLFIGLLLGFGVVNVSNGGIKYFPCAILYLPPSLNIILTIRLICLCLHWMCEWHDMGNVQIQMFFVKNMVQNFVALSPSWFPAFSNMCWISSGVPRPAHARAVAKGPYSRITALLTNGWNILKYAEHHITKFFCFHWINVNGAGVQGYPYKQCK